MRLAYQKLYIIIDFKNKFNVMKTQTNYLRNFLYFSVFALLSGSFYTLCELSSTFFLSILFSIKPNSKKISKYSASPTTK